MRGHYFCWSTCSQKVRSRPNLRKIWVILFLFNLLCTQIVWPEVILGVKVRQSVSSKHAKHWGSPKCKHASEYEYLPIRANQVASTKYSGKFASIFKHLLALWATLWLSHMLPAAASHSVRCALVAEVFWHSYALFSVFCALPWLLEQLHHGSLSWIKDCIVFGWMLASRYDSCPLMRTCWFWDTCFSWYKLRFGTN